MNDLDRSHTHTQILKQIAGYLVHLYTASGVICVLLTLQAVVDNNFRVAFAWMIVAVLIDATDGTFARRANVKKVVPHIDGRKLDDIVDYLNYTLVPVFLIVKGNFLPNPSIFWATFPLIASLFAFVHDGAKEEEAGFFRGFPSYWNIVAFYVVVWLHQYGENVVLALVLALSAMSVLPLRFVYPNRPPRWILFFVGGGILWLFVVMAIVWLLPHAPTWLIGLSLVYPTLYAVLSVYLHWVAVQTRPSSEAARIRET